MRDNSLDVSVTILPRNLFCLVSVAVARALADNAFHTPVDSLGDLLSRPNLGSQRRLRVKWKDEILDRPIFPIDYPTFRHLWNRITFVAGYRESVRPYSLRVGAGNRLDGSYLLYTMPLSLPLRD